MMARLAPNLLGVGAFDQDLQVSDPIGGLGGAFTVVPPPESRNPGKAPQRLEKIESAPENGTASTPQTPQIEPRGAARLRP